MESGRRSGSIRAASPRAPSAVSPGIRAGFPLPPEPVAKQSAPGLVGTVDVPVYCRWSVSTLPPVLITRTAAGIVPAIAWAVLASAANRASAQPAAGREKMSLGIEATLSSRVCMARPGTGLLASGLLRRAFPRRCVFLSGLLRLRLPGHSGGTAPVSHRTSLDHRPYVTAPVYAETAIVVLA